MNKIKFHLKKKKKHEIKFMPRQVSFWEFNVCDENVRSQTNLI